MPEEIIKKIIEEQLTDFNEFEVPVGSMREFIEDKIRASIKSYKKTLFNLIPPERIPKDNENADDLIDEFMKLHYEPEHEEGQTCWCHPTTTVNALTGKVYIDHKEQRVILRDFLETNFVGKPTSIENLCFGFNECRRLFLSSLKENHK